MNIKQLNQSVIEDINRGKEKAFAVLYDCYFTYLCACATTYILNPDEAKDVVNEVFVNIWQKREQLVYPVHSYLLRSVRNGCLNHLRSLRNRERVIDEYREELISFQEELCRNDEDPLTILEVEELKGQVDAVICSLPDKCRFVFEKYLYGNLSPQEIADEQGLSVNTVRVHIKHAMDKMRVELGSGIGILLIFL
ncbi:RNA polymerase sigma-70 factor [Bacteroides sp.]